MYPQKVPQQRGGKYKYRTGKRDKKRDTKRGGDKCKKTLKKYKKYKKYDKYDKYPY